MDGIAEKTAELAELLRTSPEYIAFQEASEAAFGDERTKSMLVEYRRWQAKLQAAEMSGTADEEQLRGFQALGELLQLNPATSEYLLAQYKLNALLAEVYRQLAKAVDADLSLLD